MNTIIARKLQEREETHKETEVRDFDTHSVAYPSSHYQYCYHEDKEIEWLIHTKEQHTVTRESKRRKRRKRRDQLQKKRKKDTLTSKEFLSENMSTVHSTNTTINTINQL